MKRGPYVRRVEVMNRADRPVFQSRTSICERCGNTLEFTSDDLGRTVECCPVHGCRTTPPATRLSQD